MPPSTSPPRMKPCPSRTQDKSQCMHAETTSYQTQLLLPLIIQHRCDPTLADEEE
ncbi:uncharacterized protein MYCFIDRAFT_180698 [Pseudocercospora fijiensis CIRAD86]|uniref:Uncharacterized protein n=1 Tax=Pseudocercospora fijiensis (strain CIRAD86) TaxID=383855 RepID=M2YG67_PSEFD|nr:uncharacterized protein MYCFIDRAFT_180698 [Pseudocercospora fijiensis CIRAD86]EME76795.1 hypothetical protein MYCFIDRAFT_180698 [Pseudocercospora fijiensis CIRAD86]